MSAKVSTEMFNVQKKEIGRALPTAISSMCANTFIYEIPHDNVNICALDNFL